LTSKEQDEAIIELANQVQTLRDELLVMNIYHSALTEAVCEASITGKPITQQTLEKLRMKIGEDIQKEWNRMQAETQNVN